jgi:hypothetical protein
MDESIYQVNLVGMAKAQLTYKEGKTICIILMQRLGLSPFRKKCTKRVDSEKKKLRGE